jgi:1,4-dihydroxy-2-naphthoate octaprenyltransferase
MKLHAALRSNEWWEYKLLPILLIAYITAAQTGESILSLSPWILFLFLSLVVGASYVSLINDITDIKEDVAAGKKNRMVNIAPSKRWLLPAASVLAGFVFGYFYSFHLPSLILYTLSWIAFTLYSMPPVRLKKRGIWGVLADASGSQLFPSLLMVTFISFKAGQSINTTWMLLVGVWSFALGLRGILWHQYHDLKNDQQVGLRTLATYLNSASGKWVTIVVFGLELISLAGILAYFNNPLAFICLGFYAVYVLGLTRILQAKPIAVKPPENRAYHILMSDYYQVLLPIAVLISASLIYPMTWIILVIHIILFPRNIYILLLNTLNFFKAGITKLSLVIGGR